MGNGLSDIEAVGVLWWKYLNVLAKHKYMYLWDHEQIMLADMFMRSYISLLLPIKITHSSFCIRTEEHGSMPVLILFMFHCSFYAVGFIAIQSLKIKLYD